MNQLGTEKIYWADIKATVQAINPNFYTLVNAIDPGLDFPLYLVRFPYGELIGDKISQFLPIATKGFLRLSDANLPKDIQQHLGYAKASSPMAMILDKQVEWFVDLPQKHMTLPTMIQKPGDFFSYTRVLDLEPSFTYSPMGVLSAISGARTTFMLPSIGCQTKLTKLSRELGVKIKQPNHLYDHFNLFKSILASNQQQNHWHSSFIYFSENWVEQIKNNPDWYSVQKYFYSLFVKKSMYLKNLPHYQTAYSLLLESTNQKPNPYLFDTFKHMIDMMTGEMPGFSPQVNDDLLPLDRLQSIFSNHYGLKTTTPTIMAPAYFELSHPSPKPIYYSLQFPTTRTFSPNSKKSSTMSALRELNEMCVDLFQELKKDHGFCSNTIIQHITQLLSVEFFHNTVDIDGLIKNISGLIQSDDRFFYNSQNRVLIPTEDSKFFRGCIRMGLQDSDEKNA